MTSNTSFFHFSKLQKAIREASNKADGWLFTNFSHRDTLTDELLHLNTASTATRRWIYIVPSEGEPLKILHNIEPHVLDSLPGKTEFYNDFNTLKQTLSSFSDKKFFTLCDSNNPEISTIDGGFIQLLSQVNINYLSAGEAIQRYKGVLSPAAKKSHERAALMLYRLVDETWLFISTHFVSDLPLYEKDIELFITDKFTEFSLVTDYLPVVAFGSASGNPHYGIPLNSLGRLAQKGDVIQLDIWAKEQFCTDDDGHISDSTPVYADISWVGVYDTEATVKQAEVFTTLVKARDLVFQTLSLSPENFLNANRSSCTEFSSSQSGTSVITGADLDRKVRSFLKEQGVLNAVRHRTGHGIDTSCHGSGVNLDSVEFIDNRCIIEGSCFSVEPGLYFEDFGMRTEINIYIENGNPVISGLKFQKGNAVTEIPQQQLLTIRI